MENNKTSFTTDDVDAPFAFTLLADKFFVFRPNKTLTNEEITKIFFHLGLIFPEETKNDFVAQGIDESSFTEYPGA